MRRPCDSAITSRGLVRLGQIPWWPMLLLLATAVPAGSLRCAQTIPRTPAIALIRTSRGKRCSTISALMDDGSNCSPFSKESLDTLFAYGPVVYSARVFDPEEYDASVRKIMARYPRISRALAEQEVHEFLSDGNGFLAKQTPERQRKGPSEDELKPPVALADRLLVVAWVAILVTGVTAIASLVPSELTPLEASEQLLNAASPPEAT